MERRERRLQYRTRCSPEHSTAKGLLGSEDAVTKMRQGRGDAGETSLIGSLLRAGQMKQKSLEGVVGEESGQISNMTRC